MAAIDHSSSPRLTTQLNHEYKVNHGHMDDSERLSGREYFTCEPIPTRANPEMVPT